MKRFGANQSARAISARPCEPESMDSATPSPSAEHDQNPAAIRETALLQGSAEGVDTDSVEIAACRLLLPDSRDTGLAAASVTVKWEGLLRLASATLLGAHPRDAIAWMESPVADCCRRWAMGCASDRGRHAGPGLDRA